MSYEVDRATFAHNMRGGRGYMTGNSFVDAVRGSFRERPQAPKPVIGRWEAKAYVEMELKDLGRIAEECGFSVGQTAGSRRALVALRNYLSEAIYQRYTVIETNFSPN